MLGLHLNHVSQSGPRCYIRSGFRDQEMTKWQRGRGELNCIICACPKTDFNKSVCVLVRLDNKNNMGYIFVTCALRVYPNSNMDKGSVICEIYTSYLLTKKCHIALGNSSGSKSISAMTGIGHKWLSMHCVASIYVRYTMAPGVYWRSFCKLFHNYVLTRLLTGITILALFVWYFCEKQIKRSTLCRRNRNGRPSAPYLVKIWCIRTNFSGWWWI